MRSLRLWLVGATLLGMHGCEITAQFEMSNTHSFSNSDSEKIVLSGKKVFK